MFPCAISRIDNLHIQSEGSVSFLITLRYETIFNLWENKTSTDNSVEQFRIYLVIICSLHNRPSDKLLQHSRDYCTNKSQGKSGII